MNRFNKRNIHTSKLMLAGLLLTLALLFIIACPNPNAHVWFISGKKPTQELKLKFADSKISILLSSYSGFGNEYERYRLQIRANLQFPREIKDDLHFSPETAKIYFGGNMMEGDSTHDGHLIKYIDTLSDNKYTVWLNYSYDMRIDSSIVASVYERKGVNLRIIMDNFIFYKGEPLHIDTILAVEKQPFLY